MPNQSQNSFRQLVPRIGAHPARGEHIGVRINPLGKPREILLILFARAAKRRFHVGPMTLTAPGGVDEGTLTQEGAAWNPDRPWSGFNDSGKATEIGIDVGQRPVAYLLLPPTWHPSPWLPNVPLELSKRETATREVRSVTTLATTAMTRLAERRSLFPVRFANPDIANWNAALRLKQ